MLRHSHNAGFAKVSTDSKNAKKPMLVKVFSMLVSTRSVAEVATHSRVRES